MPYPAPFVASSQLFELKKQENGAFEKRLVSAFSGQDTSISKVHQFFLKKCEQKTDNLLHLICALNFTEENRTILKKATESWRELANKQEKDQLFKVVITELFSTKTSATTGSFQPFFVSPISATKCHAQTLNFCRWGTSDISVFALCFKTTQHLEIPNKAPGLLSRKEENYVEMSELIWLERLKFRTGAEITAKCLLSSHYIIKPNVPVLWRECMISTLLVAGSRETPGGKISI